MNSYIVNFATYTLAMVGFIVLILFVYKKAMYTPINAKNREYLNVENVLKLSPTKTVYIIKAGTERFLVAGDSTNTTMLAKLDADNINHALSIEEENK
ncbi:flagellar biosynthetic protein FliO [bacterium]|nr:flagellar biosynthetic protein FliO [bacterium]